MTIVSISHKNSDKVCLNYITLTSYVLRSTDQEIEEVKNGGLAHVGRVRQLMQFFP